MTYRRLGLSVSVIAAVVAAFSVAPVSANAIPVIDDSQLQATTTTVGGVGGAPSLNTSTTVAHWFGQTTDPHNGVTYGYNMVGADPNNCSGSACDVTVEADVQPLIVNVAGLTFDGRDVMASTLASPLFATNDYGSTTAATNGDAAETRGAGGTLSQIDAGRQLQLEDATMRAQFNKTGSYHVRLHANVLPAVTIDVPSNQGTLLQSGRGVIFADVNIQWWATRIQNLQTQADSTHVPVYTTDDVLLHIGPNIFNCCVIGFHGAGIVPGKTAGPGHGNGNQPVQTYIWATYLSPGIYARPAGGRDWAVQDIHPLSHEVAEWGDDPFVNNFVEPWLTPTAPQYGCTGILETGDPVVGIGFAMGTNTFQQGPNPNGTQSADGFFHPEDEVYLPWFMRTAPNNVSEPNQTTAGGRYTLMGDLNRFAGFHTAATGC
ncbi:MAG: hypothetical protein E6I81_13370 [Chloroflexi bacterium]|nr:MAG: hypothetical protein E6I89_05320 [Chloroflexota bacterium]TMD70684.1 MAG: hypothetical protein E6I81_13370 [Chloroflexota bacterium]